MDLAEGVWNSTATLGQHIPVTIQTFQGVEAKVVVDVQYYNLNPFCAAREVNKTPITVIFSIE